MDGRIFEEEADDWNSPLSGLCVGDAFWTRMWTSQCCDLTSWKHGCSLQDRSNRITWRAAREISSPTLNRAVEFWTWRSRPSCTCARTIAPRSRLHVSFSEAEDHVGQLAALEIELAQKDADLGRPLGRSDGRRPMRQDPHCQREWPK